MSTQPSKSFASAPSIHETVASIGSHFEIDGAFVQAEAIQSGHINSTWRVTYRREEGNLNRYVLQAINSNVFRDPQAVMSNVEMVTRHINARILARREDLGGQTLNLIPSGDGTPWVEVGGVIWRCYNHIDGCVTYDVVETPRQAYEAARAFGAFQDLVSDLDPDVLIETIPDFHHTPKRFGRLMRVAVADPLGRMSLVAEELGFIRQRQELTEILIHGAVSGVLPTRVTHNDTKINNVMIDAVTDTAVCVIDLDTVMPGLALFDFGDMVRSAVSPSAEDETDLSKIEVRMPVFQAMVEGYLCSAGRFLTECELDMLVDSAIVMTLEVGIRFLQDFIEGDVYFKTCRPGQNLDRCRTQLRLVELLEERRDEMRAIVAVASGLRQVDVAVAKE